MYKAIALRFGYTSDTKLSWLVFTTKLSFDNKEDALLSLAQVLFSAYSEEQSYSDKHYNMYKEHMARCCQKNWQNDKTLKSCPTCNANYLLEYKTDFSSDDWHKFLFKLCNADFDDCSLNEDADWNPYDFNFDVPNSEIVVIPVHAKTVLDIALLKLHPNLIDEFDIDIDENSWQYKEYLEFIE